MTRVVWGAATDAGRVRDSNEDQLWADGRVFAVADGMGGHQAGEIASALAVARLRTDLSEPGADAPSLEQSILAANTEIFAAAAADPDQQGMGTTITAMTLMNGPDGEVTLALGNVGDSRTYLMRHGELHQLTVDHSYVQELVEAGHISRDEARTHPRRNIVTRALGIERELAVDIWTLTPCRGDRYVLCSDGLVDEVPDDEILDILLATGEAHTAAQALVDAANEHGGHDNVSVIVVDVVEGPEPPPAGDDGADTTADHDDGWDVSTAEIPLVDAAASTAAASTATDGTATDGTATATTEHESTDTDGDDTDDETRGDDAEHATRRRPSRLATFLVGVGVAAVLVLGATIFAAWARSGFFVAFDDTDRVVVFRGQTEPVLWFDPTVHALTPHSRTTLDERSVELVEDRLRFDSLAAAEEFVRERLEPLEPGTSSSDTGS